VSPFASVSSSDMKRNRIANGINHVDLLGIRFSGAERRSLYRLAKSKNVRDRRLCLDYLECGQGVYHNRRFIFDIADVLIPDISERVRWGTLILLGDYAESNPAQLWPVVVKMGHRSQSGHQGGCCLLYSGTHTVASFLAILSTCKARYRRRQPSVRANSCMLL